MESVKTNTSHRQTNKQPDNMSLSGCSYYTNSETRKRACIIAPSVQVKKQTIERIDRACSLYYITTASLYNVCQTAMKDALEAIRHEQKFFRHKVKYNINAALKAYDTWDRKVKLSLKERYQMWLDVSDYVDEEIKPLITTLYYCVDNCFLKNKVPYSKLLSQMETARVLLDVTRLINQSLFGNIQKQIGINLSSYFIGGDVSDILHYWDAAYNALLDLIPNIPDVNLNADPDCKQAVTNITSRFSSENIYNRAGEYALQLNPDMWKNIPREDLVALKVKPTN